MKEEGGRRKEEGGRRKGISGKEEGGMELEYINPLSNAKGALCSCTNPSFRTFPITYNLLPCQNTLKKTCHYLNVPKAPTTFQYCVQMRVNTAPV